MTLINETDYGTPRVESEAQVTLEIDGKSVTVPAGTSIMRAAMNLDVEVPKLCATDSLDPFGSCRMCLVEIEGRRGTPASCTTPAEAGMKVTTVNDKLLKLRRGVMELYLSDHPADCLTSSGNGECELHDMAGSLGVNQVRYGYEGKNHLEAEKDESNPYFTFDPAKCIVCSRCVRACEETQGTFALTVKGRGFDSKISPGDMLFMESECVSCGACVQACPTDSLVEKSVIEKGAPEYSELTTCAYCGVGCTFKAEMQGDEVIRMVPFKDGKANHGHACVKGRFAWGYTSHKDRILNPMIRKNITDPWQEVSWEEAIAYTASEFKRIQAEYGPDSIGGITSSRCTNEETFLVQKLVRAAFGNNNVDTCARVCHSPTGYGLKSTFGTSAGTNDFDSVDDADVLMVIGSNPTDAHPVFASHMKRRLREGARLIVVDPRRIDLVKLPHVQADYHLPLKPGTNVAIINAIAHVVVTEGLVDEAYVRERCDWEAFQTWAKFISEERHSPEAVEEKTGVPAEDVRGAARLYATGGNGAIYYGLGVTEHSQGSTMVIGMANIAMATGNVGKRGTGVNPMRGQNNVQGSCDMGSFPARVPRLPPRLRRRRALRVRGGLAGRSAGRAGPAHPQHVRRCHSMATSRACTSRARTSSSQTPTRSTLPPASPRWSASWSRTSSSTRRPATPTSSCRARPSWRRTAPSPTPSAASGRVRKIIQPKNGYADWEITQLLSNAMGYAMHYDHPSQIMDEIARLTPTFAGMTYEKLDKFGSMQWPVNDDSPEGTPVMHKDAFVRGKGFFMITEFVATEERSNDRFPLLLTTGRILTQYNVGAQTRRTANEMWHDEDLLEIHPWDAENRGIDDGDLVSITSRAGETTLKALVSERMQPGVVYTTFHHPESAANVVTTEFADWATDCPEYKVTAVQVRRAHTPSDWQKQYEILREQTTHIAEVAGG